MKIEKRQEKLNKIRKDGFIAGVIYGKNFGSFPIMITQEEFVSAYSKYGKVKTFKVKFEGKTHNVYFKEVERDVLKPSKIVHFSLLKVSKGDKVTAAMPIHILGVEEVSKAGLIVNQILHEVETEYPAGSDVMHLEVSVEGLEVGQTVQVKDINLPKGYEISLSEEETVATVSYPKVKQETQETAEDSKEEKPEENTNEDKAE